MIRPGRAFPLGATPTTEGTNFAVASDVADGMILCLFENDGTEHRIPMQDYDAGVWHVLVPGAGPGLRYGFRAAGPWDLARGIRCVETKLLLDPYARAITGDVTFIWRHAAWTNYWGYNSIGFFAPHAEVLCRRPGRAAGRPGGRVQVHGGGPLHAAGKLQVLLDVVFNHTAESDEARPDPVAFEASTIERTTASSQVTCGATSTPRVRTTR